MKKVNLKRGSLLSLLLCLSMASLFAQRDSMTIKNINIDLDLGFGAYYQFSSFGQTNLNSAKIPDFLPRRINEPEIRNRWGLNNDLLTDNPYFHATYFFRLGTKFQFKNALFVTAAINAEQRGFSDGVFSKNTRNFYPYFNAIYKKEFGDFSFLFQGALTNFKLQVN